MTPTPTARLFKLAPEFWANLETIAAANGTLAATGPTAGQPSVHALLGAIAAGDLVVLDKDDLRCISAKWDDFGEELARVGVFQD